MFDPFKSHLNTVLIFSSEDPKLPMLSRCRWHGVLSPMVGGRAELTHGNSSDGRTCTSSITVGCGMHHGTGNVYVRRWWRWLTACWSSLSCQNSVSRRGIMEHWTGIQEVVIMAIKKKKELTQLASVHLWTLDYYFRPIKNVVLYFYRFLV